MADLAADELRDVCERVRETTHRVINDTHRTVAEVRAERTKRAARLLPAEPPIIPVTPKPPVSRKK